MRFAGKIVFITGASSGLGAELARQLSREGARLALFARRSDRLEQVSAEIATAGFEKPTIAVCDVADRKAVMEVMEAATVKLGVPDILVANAGVGFPMKAERFDTRRAEDMYRTNVFGVLTAIEAVLPAMIKRGSGQIVGVSSLAAYRAFPKSHTYSATKAALFSHLEGLRMELRPKGIAVTTICPGFVRTDMTGQNSFPMPILMEIEPAVRRMVHAIAARKAVANFPRRLYWFIRLTRLVPEWLVAKFV